MLRSLSGVMSNDNRTSQGHVTWSAAPTDMPVYSLPAASEEGNLTTSYLDLDKLFGVWPFLGHTK